MKGFKLVVLAAVCFMAACSVLVSCGHNGQENNSTLKDSIYNVENIKATVMTDPAKALNMLDTAENKKLIPRYDIYGLKSIIYNNVFNQRNVALNYMRKTYECPECAKDTTLLIKTLKALGMLCCQLGYYTDAAKYLKEGMEVSRKVGDVNGEAYFTMNMGFVKSELGTTAEAVEDLNESIALFKKTGLAETDFYVADNLLMACLKKMDLLCSKKELKKAEEAMTECQEAYDRLSKIDDIPHNQLDIRLAEMSTMKGMIYHDLGNKEQAERCFDIVVHTEYAKTPAGTTTVIPCFIRMGKYKAALESLKQQEIFYIKTQDTISRGYVDIVLYNQMVAYDKLGMYKEASSTGLRLKALNDSLSTQERNGRVMEMMTIYETDTKEAMLRENALKMSRMRLFIYAVGIACILLMVVIGIVLYYNKRIRRRNLATVKTIEELMEQKDDLLDFHINHAEDVEQTTHKTKKLKEYFSDVHMSNAVKMLKSDSTHTIAEIASACGFASENEFCHFFEKKYGISPSDYRKWSNYLREKEQQGVDNEEFKRNLLRNISHEIRTPLNQISGYVQLLTSPKYNIDQSDKEQFKDIILSQANHMTLMLNDFVEITEYESDKKELKGEDITMQDLLDRMCASAGEPQNGVKLNVCQLSSPLRVINIPVKAMVRIAECLLNNAFKFTAKGHIDVEFMADDDKGMLRLSVADTGKGVSPENAEQIFERFYKEDEFVPGVGLGLPLVRIIATRMGGTVCLDTSYKGPGARFVVEIPM